VKPTAPTRPRHRRVAIAAALAAAALVAVAAHPDPAEAAAAPKILKPNDGAHVRGDRMVARVKVRGKRFRAFLAGRDVTKRFTRRGGGKRRAVFKAGRDYGVRNRSLIVRVGPRDRSRTDTAGFFAMRRDDTSMRVNYRTDRLSRPARLLRVRTKRRLWNTQVLPKVKLNGRRVEGELELHTDDRGIAGGLGPHAGLRHGRNRVQVEILQRDGRYARDVRSFRVRRDRVLAGAGPDRRTGVGEPVALDGSATRLPPRLTGTAARREPRYRWRVVKAPRGSSAQLERPRSVDPVLTPDVPGTYRVRLTAAPAGGGKAGVDEVTVTAPQTDSPMGMPIQTITDSGGIALGSTSYERQGSGVKMLVLSASALVATSGNWGPADQTFTPQSNGKWVNSANQRCGDLVTCVKDVDNQHIVVLTGQGQPVPGGRLSGSQSKSLERAIEEIGGTVATYGPTQNGAASLAGGAWSVIGNRTLTEGHAEQSFFQKQAAVPPSAIPEFPNFPTDSGSAGALNGYMQKINQAAYQYVSPEYVDIDTKWTPSLSQAPSPTQNIIKVGDLSDTSDSIPNGAIAFQMLVLGSSSDKTIEQRVLDRGTFVVLDPNCSTNSAGVEGLNEKLDQWVNARPGPPADGTELVIVQDFGRQPGSCWPGGSGVGDLAGDPSWVQDTLPPVYAFGGQFNWWGPTFCRASGCGIYQNSRGDLFKSWNESNRHGTVAGNLGKLAGVPAHDVVANYRRPYYDDATGQGEVDCADGQRGKCVNRDFGGLTAVASTNLYQWSDAFYQGQGDDAALSDGGDNQLLANGRITGVLRRNEQSQWVLANSALGAGWQSDQPDTGGELNPKALWDLVFQQPAGWPCTPENPSPCPNIPSEIKAAQQYFVEQVSPDSGVASIRELYADGYLDGFDVTKVQRAYPNPAPGPGYFSEQVYDALQNGVGGSWQGLVGEVGDANQVADGIEGWQNFFIAVGKQNAVVDIKDIGQRIITNVQRVDADLMNDQATMGAWIAGDLLDVLSSIIDVGLIASGNPELVPLLAPAVGAMSGMAYLGADTSSALTQDGPGSGQGNVPNETDAINDEVGNLMSDISARYSALAQSIEHFGAVFVDDPGKLAQAATNFDPGGPWSIPSGPTEVTTGQAMAVSAQTSAYQATLPLAFNQWMISPRHTNRNPSGSADLPGAKSYACADTLFSDEAYADKPPWQGTPTWAMSSVGWSGGAGRGDFTPQEAADFTVRGLKSRINDMQPGLFQDESMFRDVYEAALWQQGTNAPTDLLQPLFGTYNAFGTPENPGPLGADKEEIFGMEAWKIKLLQCGSPPLVDDEGEQLEDRAPSDADPVD
jgi:hypothetical protein